MPKVTVIIPVYNSSLYIEQALESVLNQKYNDIEIIAVNDGSTDDTILKLCKYKKYIKILHHPGQSNLGAAASMNLGILYSNSDYLAFLDSDDMFYDNKILNQVEVLEKFKDVGLVYTNGNAIDEQCRYLYDLFKVGFIEKNVFGAMLLNCYISAGPSTIMIRRDLLSRTGIFDPILTYSKDHDMWIRLSEVTKFYYISDKLMAYRRHEGQQSQKREQWEQGFYVLKKAIIRNRKYSLNLIRKRIAVLFYRLGTFDMHHNKVIKGCLQIFFAGIADPKRAFKLVCNNRI